MAKYSSDVNKILDLILQYASGKLETRGVHIEDGDELDAIMLGLNMLGEELEYQTAEQKRLEAEKLAVMGQVARSVGHDLRNPLTAIASAAYILKDEVGDKGQKMLKLISRNIDSTERVIRNLIDFEAETELSLAEADVNALIKKELSSVVVPKNVRTIVKYGDISLINVDQEQLKRVILNLVLNALQAMPEGGELTVSTRRSRELVEIVIKDTGVGISKENLKKIFIPLYTTKAQGMGLGLVNAKRVVEAHNGTIHIESEVGKGTTVIVKLPVDS